ncbi:DUF1972 domain-containing protein [Arthrobacter sp. zg-Y20]|uniref:DUF1972 domain-containing protein n=1 Tax=unclassified Arthrobacter TaxID=235627 RepID=UPI003FA4557B
MRGPARQVQPGLRIAMVGTRGVPARYGGFETCVEQVGQRLAARGHEVTVYCRTDSQTDTSETEYLGMELVYLPALHRRTLETLTHTGLSVLHLLRHRPDAAIVFNAANSPWLPLLRTARIPVATHVDGLEWKRAKWGPAGQRYYRGAEALAVRFSDALIADAQGIQDYYRDKFGADSTLLTYGAPAISGAGSRRLAEVDLVPGQYQLVVARMEPENHVHLIVEGYVHSGSELPLVVVGSAPYSERYTAAIRRAADSRVRFLGGVWDQELLDQLYANARVYWHGHSVGGTNPSLLRAMGAGTAVNAFDVGFNREVLGDAGRFFRTAEDVAKLALDAEESPAAIAERGLASTREAARYDWTEVSRGYERLVQELAAGEGGPPRPSRRRRRGVAAS